MKPGFTGVFLPERPVRWLGMGLVAVGLVFPFAVLIIRAANWQPTAESLDLELVILPKGTFSMGSPENEDGRDDDETLHEVELSSFALSRTEITQWQYHAVMEEKPVDSRIDFFDAGCSDAGVGDDLPVVCIDWFEAVSFCNELSKREGLEPAYEMQGEEVTWDRTASGYRLPTEAEWEYAARAGTRFTWVGTNEVEEVCEYGNVADASAQEKFRSTFSCNDAFPALAPVRALKANRWLLFGLGGNAAEWVWDAYGLYPENAGPNPALDGERASYRVIRGGSWWSGPRVARVADRVRGGPSRRFVYVGFRVARSLPSSL